MKYHGIELIFFCIPPSIYFRSWKQILSAATMEFLRKHYVYKDFIGNALAWHIWRLIASKMNGLNVIPNHFLNIAILKFHFSFRRVLTSTTVKKYLKRMYWYDTLFFFYSQTSLHSFYIFIGCFRGIFFIHFLFLPYISRL